MDSFDSGFKQGGADFAKDAGRSMLMDESRSEILVKAILGSVEKDDNQAAVENTQKRDTIDEHRIKKLLN